MNFKRVKAMVLATTMMVATLGSASAFAATNGVKVGFTSESGDAIVEGDVTSNAVFSSTCAGVKMSVPANITFSDKAVETKITISKVNGTDNNKAYALGGKKVYVYVDKSDEFTYKNDNVTDTIIMNNRLEKDNAYNQTAISFDGIELENADSHKVEKTCRTTLASSSSPKYVGKYNGTINYKISLGKYINRNGAN